MLRLLLLICISLSCWAMTLPLSIQMNNQQTLYSHLQSRIVTKQLRALKAIFTTSLIVSGKAYEMTVDTGSSHFLIKGERMTGIPPIKYSCEECMKDDYPKSSISYLDGNMSIYTKTLNITLTSTLTFQQTISIGYFTTSKNFDYMGGVLGLALRQSCEGGSSFLETLKENNIIQKKIFAVKLNFKKVNQSFITFGSVDSRFLAPNATIRYYQVPNMSRGFIIGITGAFIGDYALPISQALFDTGNTCITFPDMYTTELIDSFREGGNQCHFQQEPGNIRFSILLCKITDFFALPVIKILIGRDLYEISQQYYLEKCYQIKNSSDSFTHICQTLVETVKSMNEMFLGAAFFLKFYGVFNLDRNLVGIARNNDITTLADINGYMS